MSLWIRAAIFTVVAPLLIGGVIPYELRRDGSGSSGLIWLAGLGLIAAGAAVYGMSVRHFVDAGGTPNMFFLRFLRSVLGDETRRVVRKGPYRYSRNPMYIAVLAMIFGQAIVWFSPRVAAYGLLMFVIFHIVIVTLEEPHLRTRFGTAYEDMVLRVPRWL